MLRLDFTLGLGASTPGKEVGRLRRDKQCNIIVVVSHPTLHLIFPKPTIASPSRIVTYLWPCRATSCRKGSPTLLSPPLRRVYYGKMQGAQLQDNGQDRPFITHAVLRSVRYINTSRARSAPTSVSVYETIPYHSPSWGVQILNQRSSVPGSPFS